MLISCLTQNEKMPTAKVTPPLTKNRYRKLKKKGRIPSGRLTTAQRQRYFSPPKQRTQTVYVASPPNMPFHCVDCGEGSFSAGTHFCPMCQMRSYFD